ncbi:MAG TPA: MlaD family protein [Flavobacteriaceae bacterium]|nr:MlaD family protein [Flavobacteriaceae bacterium]
MKLSKEIRTALFVLVSILLFIFGFNFLKGTSILDKQKTLYAIYSEVDGLMVGASVSVNGLAIGNVTSLDFLANSTKVIVTLKVKDKLRFSPNSTATLYETGLIGGIAIAIEPVFENGNIVKSGDTLKSTIRPGLTELINEQVQPLQRNLQSILVSVDSLFIGVTNIMNQDSQNNLKIALDEMTSAISLINSTAKILENTITTNESTINNSIKNIEGVSSNMQKITDSLADSNLSETISNLEKSIEGINKAVRDLNSDSSSLGLLIRKDEFYNTLNSSVNDLNELLIDLKSNPKRYVHFSIFGRKDKSSDND